MSKHMERIREQQAAYAKGKRQRNGLALVTIVVCVGLLYGVKAAGRYRQKAETQPPASASEILPEYSRPEDSYWNLRLISAASPISQEINITLTEVEGVRVDARIAQNLRDMLTAAQKAGITLTPTEGYRTMEEQDTLRQEQLAAFRKQGRSEEESLSLTNAILAMPGESDYHTGLSVLFAGTGEKGFADTPAGKWLLGNATSFGFILRYPEGKESLTGRTAQPGQYRYVGPETAAAMKELNLCLEEYREQVFTQNARPEETSENGR